MKYDVIVVFLFGLPMDSPRNLKLAERAASLSNNLGVPIFDESAFVESMGWHDGNGAPWISSTLKFAKALAKEGANKRWKNALVIAAPCHVWRCVRDLRQFGLYAKADKFFIGARFYDKNSEHWWTRCASLWWIRELSLRLMPWWLYSRIAG